MGGGDGNGDGDGDGLKIDSKRLEVKSCRSTRQSLVSRLSHSIYVTCLLAVCVLSNVNHISHLDLGNCHTIVT